MKITNAEVIKSGERDLIDSITADLDWGAIEDVFLTEHHLGIDEDIEYKRGDIIAYNNQVAYKLEFTVKVNLSVLINRDGEYLSINISDKKDLQETGEIHESANEPETEDSVKNDINKKDGDPVAGEQCLSGDNIEQKYANDDIEVKEDKYIEALEQLDSNDLNEDILKGIDQDF